jgi:hypothetical protein
MTDQHPSQSRADSAPRSTPPPSVLMRPRQGPRSEIVQVLMTRTRALRVTTRRIGSA